MTPPCPSCGEALTVEQSKLYDYIVHCPHGECPSRVSNDGAWGNTVEEAVDALAKLIEKEREK